MRAGAFLQSKLLTLHCTAGCCVLCAVCVCARVAAVRCEHTNLATTLPAQLSQLQDRLAQYRDTAVLSWLNYLNNGSHTPDPGERHLGLSVFVCESRGSPGSLCGSVNK